MKKEKKEILESEKIMEHIAEENEEKERIHNINYGLSLGNHFLRRLGSISREERDNRMNDFVNACENIVQTIMLRKIQRMDIGDDEDEEFGAVQFIVPVGVFST